MIKISNSILEYIDPYIIIYPTLSNIISRSLVLVNPEWGSKLPFHLWPEMTGNKVPVACFSGMASLIQLRDWLAVSDPHYLGRKQQRAARIQAEQRCLELVELSSFSCCVSNTVDICGCMVVFTKDHDMQGMMSLCNSESLSKGLRLCTWSTMMSWFAVTCSLYEMIHTVWMFKLFILKYFECI